MTFEIVETKRLHLRKLTPEVYEYIFMNYSKKEIKAFLGIVSEEEFEKISDKYEKGMATYNKSFVNFLLIDKLTGKVIGDCGFHTWYVHHFRAEVGYSLLYEEDKRKGYMSEALAAIIAYGFEEMNLHRIEAFVAPNNVPSLSLLKKMNFQAEGCLKEHYLYKGKFEDSLIFSLLKGDYFLL